MKYCLACSAEGAPLVGAVRLAHVAGSRVPYCAPTLFPLGWRAKAAAVSASTLLSSAVAARARTSVKANVPTSLGPQKAIYPPTLPLYNTVWLTVQGAHTPPVLTST